MFLNPSTLNCGVAQAAQLHAGAGGRHHGGSDRGRAQGRLRGRRDQAPAGAGLLLSVDAVRLAFLSCMCCRGFCASAAVCPSVALEQLGVAAGRAEQQTAMAAVTRAILETSNRRCELRRRAPALHALFTCLDTTKDCCKPNPAGPGGGGGAPLKGAAAGRRRRTKFRDVLII